MNLIPIPQSRNGRALLGRAICLVGLGALTACGPANSPSGGSGGLVGSPAPELVVEAVSGEGPKTLAEANGQVVIVDFWATYCDPCRKSFPAYQEIVDKYAGKVAVIAVSVDEADAATAEDVQKFADDLGVSFGIVWDKTQKTAATYNPPKMPTSYIIDGEGVVRHVHAGFTPDEHAKMEANLAALVK